MITEDYVSEETAKLLIERGFDEKVSSFYPHGNIQRPTLQMACKWLRKVYKIMVSPYALSFGYYFEIFDLTSRDITGCKSLYKVGIPNKEDVFSSFEEACDRGIRFTLENITNGTFNR